MFQAQLNISGKGVPLMEPCKPLGTAAVYYGYLRDDVEVGTSTFSFFVRVCVCQIIYNINGPLRIFASGHN